MQHFDTVIIGAGVSGLSAARLLKEKGIRVVVLEKESKPGGLIKCDRVSGHLFHRVGGHVFNTHIQEVGSWFWAHFNKENEFHLAKRKAGIQIQSKIIGYPIENYIYELDEKSIKKIVNELIDLELHNSSSSIQYSNFQSFLKGNFGNTLYKLYFEPYNQKIWKTDLSKTALPWLDKKLPMPNYRETILNNILRKEDKNMVHSQFYYPRNNGSQFIADTLSKGLNIAFNTPVDSIVKKANNWIVNDTYCAEKVVFTGDIRSLSAIVKDINLSQKQLLESVKDLNSNGTSNLLCTIDENNYSWLYLPEKKSPAHRIILTGNFSSSNNRVGDRRSCTIEFSGYTPLKEMKKAIKQLPFNPEYFADNYEPNSYVIQQIGDSEKIYRVKQALQEVGVFLVGRFAEWEYFNMDKAIESAMIVTTKMLSRSK